MSCKCDSGRLIMISGKCNDAASMSIPHLDFDHHGTTPHIGLCDGVGGDYLELTICLDCGKIQDWEPKTDEELMGTLVDEGLVEGKSLDEGYDDEVEELRF